MHSYVFVRKDLSIPQIVVQTAHATLELARSGFCSNLHPHLVVLEIDNEKNLLKIPEMLQQLDIRYTPFIEPDRNFETTAIATEPVSSDKRKHFRKFKLLKGDSNASLSC